MQKMKAIGWGVEHRQCPVASLVRRTRGEAISAWDCWVAYVLQPNAVEANKYKTLHEAGDARVVRVYIEAGKE